ncbi:MAG: cadherin repeat domain-containing protein, partial [Allomuricauda sp.]
MKKIAHLTLALAMGSLLFWACSKNDNDTAPIEENKAPVIKAQTFTVLESASEIGTVVATDEDGDQLDFSITANDNDLFAIDNAGKITLAEGRALDFDTTPSHAITVGVDDGEETASAQITINLTDTNDIAPVFSM